MPKKLFAPVLSALLASSLLPMSAHAALIISEVMYDPDGADAGREWVEIWNDGSAAVDLTSVILLEADTKHKIVPLSAGSASLAPGGYAIVADKPELFAIDYPHAGPVFDSAFSLSNTGERLALVNADGGEFSSAEWNVSSAASGGKSWQRSGVSWLAALATPGARNADRESAPAALEATASSSAATGTAAASLPAAVAISAHSGTGGLTTVRRETALAIDAGRDRIVPVGAELSVRPEIAGAERAGFSWVWGDGATSRGRIGRHTYRFPGTYALVLNARSAGGAGATSRAKVVVLPTQVSVAVAGEGDQAAVAMTSRSANELNLGGFLLESGDSSFELPTDTILLPGSTTLVPADVAGFALRPGAEVALRRPDGQAVRLP